mmetsp:Transcript_58904/g.104184  ORF Transcript_58904/g.104184 Transcript_58904/m.104184 type:complete len:122 (+) Transcript_58904:62-427(+)
MIPPVCRWTRYGSCPLHARVVDNSELDGVHQQVLYSIAELVKNYAVIYLVDTTEVPDFNTMYELYDPCTVMFFYRNKVSPTTSKHVFSLPEDNDGHVRLWHMCYDDVICLSAVADKRASVR